MRHAPRASAQTHHAERDRMITSACGVVDDRKVKTGANVEPTSGVEPLTY